MKLKINELKQLIDTAENDYNTNLVCEDFDVDKSVYLNSIIPKLQRELDRLIEEDHRLTEQMLFDEKMAGESLEQEQYINYMREQEI